MSLPSAARASTRRLSSRSPAPPAAEPAALLRLRGMRGGGAAPALRDLSLDVTERAWVTLLGPPGAGKTTALHLVAGLLAPQSGELLFRATPFAPLSAHRRGFALVADEPRLFPHLTVAENVAWPLRLRGMHASARTAAAAQWLGLLGLTGDLDRKPAELPAAVALRVAVARALAAEPRMLLLDDPLRSLDPGTRAELIEDLRRLHGELGLTVLHATRDPAEALALSNSVAVLADGTLQQAGPAATLYESPANTRVARMFGACNLLPGTIAAMDEGIAQVRLRVGPTVAAEAAGLSAGAACVVHIRPERVALAATEDLGGDALAARVDRAEFCGDHVRVMLRIGPHPGLPFEVRRPVGASLAGLAAGEVVSVAWQPHHARALPV
jgi:ABC-type Fe3+/spermidine/putrescine transport system ATPase subunit